MFDRRRFIASSVATSIAASAVHSELKAAEEKKTLTVGVMGMSRGKSLATDFAKTEGVRLKYVCDVDTKRLDSAAVGLQKLTDRPIEKVTDFRQMLDDKEVDAFVCAAPNHWHGPSTILACKAGKHVYVEKPCSHNGQEGEWMVEAAEKYKRCVQMGTQRRSIPRMIEAIEKVRSGVIGKAFLSRSFYTNLRGSIGTGKPGSAPDYLDYDLWQGPAPHRHYQDNIVHYNWHWQWHWGGGELANNGVHALDICRWGLDVDFPVKSTVSGGRYCYDDDQETPDTQVAAFEFDSGQQITWQANSCNKHKNNPFVLFYGTEGAMEIDSNGAYRIYDRANKLVEEQASETSGQPEHILNFVESARTEDASKLNQPITEGHRSTLLCHLGNIAYRTGGVLETDPTNGHVIGTDDQKKLWRRDYSDAWESQVTTV